MGKRVSDRQRLINAAFAAENRAEIDGMIETLISVRDNKFPEVKKAKKSNATKGTARVGKEKTEKEKTSSPPAQPAEKTYFKQDAETDESKASSATS